MRSKRKLEKFNPSVIIRLRTDAGWTQTQVAKAIDCTAANISILEKGRNFPSVLHVMRLADLFNVSFATILGANDELDLHDDINIFYRRFKDLLKLTHDDRKLIEKLIQRLKKRV